MISLPARRAISLSIVAGLVTLALKSMAYFYTGSVGLFSDAADAVINLMAAGTAFFSLWYAARPVDPSHTYGHEKMEYFASVLEGGLILAAAVGVIWVATSRLLAPQEFSSLEVGVVLAAIASLVNLAVSRVLLRAGRFTESIVIGSRWPAPDDRCLELCRRPGRTGVGAPDRLALAGSRRRPRRLPQYLLDRLRPGPPFLHGLLDHALPEQEVDAVRQAIESQLGPGRDYHALRTRQAGTRRFADCHLLVPGIFTVRRAHELTGRVETAIRNVFPGIEVTVHIEPIEDRAAWEDSELLPLEEAARRARQAKERT